MSDSFPAGRTDRIIELFFSDKDLHPELKELSDLCQVIDSFYGKVMDYFDRQQICLEQSKRDIEYIIDILQAFHKEEAFDMKMKEFNNPLELRIKFRSNEHKTKCTIGALYKFMLYRGMDCLFSAKNKI